MTKQTRRKFSAEFKAKVALEAAKEKLTLAELAKKFEVNQVLISRWKAELLENMAVVFSKNAQKNEDNADVNTEKLFAQIGKLKVENDFLKKSCEKLGI